MQHLREILRGAVAPSGEAPVEDAGPAPCPVCGGTGFLRRDVPPGHPDFGRALACECGVRRLREARVASWPAGMTFASWDNRNVLGAKVRAECERYAAGQSRYPILVLTGPFGLGKTHLAVSVLQDRAHRGELGTFWLTPDLLDWWRQGMGDDDVGPDRVAAVAHTPGVLVLDDFGRERATPWAKEKLYQLVDYRYRNEMALIVTTNIPIEQLDPAVVDRITDKRKAKVLTLRGPSYRTGI